MTSPKASGGGLGIILGRRRVSGPVHGLDDGDATLLGNLPQARGQPAIGDEGLHLADVADTHGCGAPSPFAVVQTASL